MDEFMQLAQSLKYTATPVALVPVPGGFVLFRVRGAAREPLGTFTPAQLIEWLRLDFARVSREREDALAAEEARRSADPLANLSFGGPL